MLFSNAFTSWQFLLLVWFWCSLSIFLGYPLWLVKLTEYFGTITQDLKLTVASYIWHVARCKWCLMLHFPVVIAASFSQTLPLCSGHQAQSCNLSWQEGMNDENNWLWAGMKVQLNLSIFASKIQIQHPDSIIWRHFQLFIRRLYDCLGKGTFLWFSGNSKSILIMYGQTALLVFIGASCADFGDEFSQVVARLYYAPRPMGEVPADLRPEEMRFNPLPGTSSCCKR